MREMWGLRKRDVLAKRKSREEKEVREKRDHWTCTPPDPNKSREERERAEGKASWFDSFRFGEAILQSRVSLTSDYELRPKKNSLSLKISWRKSHNTKKKWEEGNKRQKAWTSSQRPACCALFLWTHLAELLLMKIQKLNLKTWFQSNQSLEEESPNEESDEMVSEGRRGTLLHLDLTPLKVQSFFSSSLIPFYLPTLFWKWSLPSRQRREERKIYERSTFK